MSQFNPENSISGSSGNMSLPWQRKSNDRSMSQSIESGLNSLSLCRSTGRTPKGGTPGLNYSGCRHNRSRTPTSSGRSSLNKTPRSRSACNTPGSGGDRFIPNRSAMNTDLAHYLIMSKNNSNEGDSLATENYKKRLGEVCGVPQNAKILSFKEKAPEANSGHANNLKVLYSAQHSSSKPAGPANRPIPQVSERILDAPNLIDDYYLSTLSWSCTNLLAIALNQTVYIWNASTGDIAQLCELESDDVGDYVSAVSWMYDGNHLAVSTSTGHVQLWDVGQEKMVRNMMGHAARVSALAWNQHILTSGCRSGAIHQHDVRAPDHHVGNLYGHSQEVCGLSWHHNGRYLASGGNDNNLMIWDNTLSMTGSTPLHTMSQHQGAIKALAWCPYQGNILASGGGTSDRTIRLWNTHSGACIKTIDTNSQVSALMWCPHYKELISAHGFARFQLSVWKWPQMTKITDLTGHSARVLNMAMSPDGQVVASAGADETLRLWRCFGIDKTKKSVTKSSTGCIALSKGIR